MKDIDTTRFIHAVKIFAELQWSAEAYEVSFINEETNQQVNNPWIDVSGRFPLSDEEAVATYGHENVARFVRDAVKYLQLT